MNTLVDIIEMPAVRNIISNAEQKIESMTGCKVKLYPEGVSIGGLPADMKKLIRIVEKEFNLPWHRIIKKDRTEAAKYARYAYAWINVKIIKKTWVKTGEELGGLDHTTVGHAIEVMKGHLDKGDNKADQLLRCMKEYKTT